MVLSLGIDVGTTSVKVTVLNTTTLEVLATNKLYHGNKSSIKDTKPNFHEQDAICILNTLIQCIQGIPKSCLSNVTIISVSGQMHGVVLWSKSENQSILADQNAGEFCNLHVSTLITWQDGRCSPEFLSSIPKSSPPLATGFGCASLFWLQKNCPVFVDSYECAGSIMDVLVYQICNLKLPVMSPQVAYSWGYFDINENTWQNSV